MFGRCGLRGLCLRCCLTETFFGCRRRLGGRRLRVATGRVVGLGVRLVRRLRPGGLVGPLRGNVCIRCSGILVGNCCLMGGGSGRSFGFLFAEVLHVALMFVVCDAACAAQCFVCSLVAARGGVRAARCQGSRRAASDGVASGFPSVFHHVLLWLGRRVDHSAGRVSKPDAVATKVAAVYVAAVAVVAFDGVRAGTCASGCKCRACGV